MVSTNIIALTNAKYVEIKVHKCKTTKYGSELNQKRETEFIIIIKWTIIIDKS